MATRKGHKPSLLTRPESTVFKHAASDSTLDVIYQQHMAQAIGVTLMRAQMHVILQAAYNGHQRNATPVVCSRSDVATSYVV